MFLQCFFLPLLQITVIPHDSHSDSLTYLPSFPTGTLTRLTLFGTQVGATDMKLTTALLTVYCMLLNLVYNELDGLYNLLY